MNGFTPLLIDARLAKENTINLVEQSAAKAVFADEKEDYGVPCFTLASVYESDSNPDFVPHWGDKVIFCSSGTTGAIKLMVFDGKALCAQIMSATSIPSHSQTLMHPGKINILGMIPFHHVFGFVAVFQRKSLKEGEKSASPSRTGLTGICRPRAAVSLILSPAGVRKPLSPASPI